MVHKTKTLNDSIFKKILSLKKYHVTKYRLTVYIMEVNFKCADNLFVHNRAKTYLKKTIELKKIFKQQKDNSIY